jgi:diaminopimelate decarboxylase
VPARIHFALKSCYRPPVLRCLRRLGAGAEVMSALEYDLALAAGWDPADIVVNGLGRSVEFLSRASGSLIIIDSLDDLRRVPAGPVRLGVRLRPPVDGPYGQPSKLGLEGEELALVLADPRVELLHVHVTSQALDPSPYLQALEWLAHTGLPGDIDLGGGLELPDAPWLAAIGARFAELFPKRRLLLEPGRALVNAAGFLVTTVTAVKGFNVVVDAGTNCLMPHREATYRVLQPGPGEVRVNLVDGITSLTSVLLRDVGLERLPRVADRLILGNCGAYTSSMSQFWGLDPVPTAFLDRDGELHPDLTIEQLRAARKLLLGA